MMNLSNDLNILAANNVIGYDTCSSTMSSMGSRYNPYGVGVVNTGLKKDIYSPNSVANQIGAVSLSACAFAFLGRLFADAVYSSGTNKKNKSILNSIKKALGIKVPRRAAKKTVAKGFKGFISKVGKCCKATAIVAGVGALAVGGMKLYQQYKMRNMPLNVYGQSQDTVSFNKNETQEVPEEA